MKVAIWGAGLYGRQAIEYINSCNDKEIIALGDIDSDKAGTMLNEYEVLSKERFAIKVKDADSVLISIHNYEPAYRMMIDEFNVDISCIYVWRNLKVQKVYDLHSFSVHSQDGEELYLRERFSNIENGTYVDVGAYHPIIYSNTLWAYEKGWRGINIEPNPENFKLFKLIRDRDININCGISQTGGYLTYYKLNLAGCNTFNKQRVEKCKSEFGLDVIGTEEINTVPLWKIFEDNNIKHIDFIDIDVEDFEMEVLKSIDFSKVNIECLLIEQLDSNLEDVIKSDIAIFLKQYGYCAVSKFDRTVIYEKC